MIVFDYIVVDMIANIRLEPKVTELFVWGRKLITSLVFITQSYLTIPKNVNLISTHYFIMKIPNKKDFIKNVLIKIKNYKKREVAKISAF